MGLTKAVAKEWGPLGLRCNAIAYGLIDTRLTRPKEEGASIMVRGLLGSVLSPAIAVSVSKVFRGVLCNKPASCVCYGGTVQEVMQHLRHAKSRFHTCQSAEAPRTIWKVKMSSDLCHAPQVGDRHVALGIPSANDYWATVKAMVPLRRVGTASEAAGAILLLASPWAGYITGQCLEVNGGSFM